MTDASAVRPMDFRLVGENEFLITWNDGHRSLFQARHLRFLCPCAQCVDERTGKRMIAWSQILSDIKILRAEPVGRYAYKLQFSDTHQTGIYSFEFLRALCPCPQCRSEDAPQP